MSWNFRLYEDDRLFRVDAYSHVERGDIKDVLLQFFRILRNGDGVLVDYAVDAVIIVLELNELFESSKIVSQMNISGRLYS